MFRKELLLLITLLIVFSTAACKRLSTGQGPKWKQVQSVILEVISNWHIDVLTGSKSDNCDIATTSIAKRWAEEEDLKGIGSFVLKELTKEAVSKVINLLFPASCPVEVLRSQIAKWTLEREVVLASPFPF